MGKIAFLFSGQGSQYSGMGRELYDGDAVARVLMDRFEQICPGLTALCFEGAEKELSRTEKTQPCVYGVSAMAAAVLLNAGVRPDMLAGFSLGEITALAVSGVFTLEDGFRIVMRRAELMSSGCEGSGMLAVLKLGNEEVAALCAEIGDVYPANYNCDGQIVVGGGLGALEKLRVKVREAGGKAMPLKVSGAFHTKYMQSAADKFYDVLCQYEMGKMTVPVYSNVTGEVYGSEIRKILRLQMKSPVMWSRTIREMVRAGADTFVELGPGKTLTALVARIAPKVRVFSAGDIDGISKTVLEVTGCA